MPRPVWGDLGLFLTPPPGRSPSGGWQDCNNVRVYQHRVSSFNIGWTKYLAQQLNGPVVGIFEFAPTGGTKKSVFATLKDLYQNTPGSATVTYITPRYNTGTASRTGAAVTGVGTLWLANAKAGDEIHFGSATQDSLSATWYEILTVNSDTSITLVGSPGGSDGSGAYTIRKRFTGNTADLWFSEVFPRAGHAGPADRFYMTNGADSVVEWDGTATAVTEVTATLGFRAKYIKRYKNMMIYAHVTTTGGSTRPYEMRNSLPGFPLDMASVGAGVFTVSPGDDPIQQIETLGDELSIYTDAAIVQAQFVESPVFFIFRTATQQTGLLAPRLIANFGEFHLFLGVDAEYKFNGVDADKVNTHVWTTALATMDPARLRQSFAAFDEQFGDLYWAVCKTTDSGAGTGGPASSALTEHYLEALSDVPVTMEEGDFHPFAKRDFPFHCIGSSEQTTSLTWNQIVGTWAQQTFKWNDKFLSAAFPLVLGGNAAGYVMKLNTVNHQDGIGFPSFVQFVRRQTMEGSRAAIRGRGLVSRVYPLAKRLPGVTYSLTVTTTVYDHIDDAGSSTVLTFPLDASGNRFVLPYRRGVWFDVQFGTLGSSMGEPWELQGYDVDVLAGGER